MPACEADRLRVTTYSFSRVFARSPSCLAAFVGAWYGGRCRVAQLTPPGGAWLCNLVTSHQTPQKLQQKLQQKLEQQGSGLSNLL
jgi:hypothetical protein